MRFSKHVKNGNFQLWNMRYFNFYNGGFEVLLHSKPWKTDLAMPTSVAFLVEGLNVNEYPELLFFDNRQTQRRCFRKATRSTRTMLSNDAADDDAEIDPTTTRVTIQNGQVVASDGSNLKPKKKHKRTWRKNRKNKSN